jgi:hypothetical membrane protein
MLLLQKSSVVGVGRTAAPPGATPPAGDVLLPTSRKAAPVIPSWACDSSEMAGTQTGTARLVAGGVLWLTSAQFFLAQALAQHAWRGSAPYSLRRSWISDLGATTCGSYEGGGGIVVCSPRHALLNGGLVLLGGQVLIGAALLKPLLPAGRLARPAIGLLMVSGAALPFVAGFPEDTGKPWHALAATVHLATAGLGTIATGLALRGTGHPKGAAVTLVLGGASLLGTVLTGAGVGLGVGRGAVERLAAWPFTAWTTIAGGLAVASLLRGDRRAVHR